MVLGEPSVVSRQLLLFFFEFFDLVDLLPQYSPEDTAPIEKVVTSTRLLNTVY